MTNDSHGHTKHLGFNVRMPFGWQHISRQPPTQDYLYYLYLTPPRAAALAISTYVFHCIYIHSCGGLCRQNKGHTVNCRCCCWARQFMNNQHSRVIITNKHFDYAHTTSTSHRQLWSTSARSHMLTRKQRTIWSQHTQTHTTTTTKIPLAFKFEWKIHINRYYNGPPKKIIRIKFISHALENEKKKYVCVCVCACACA